MSADSLLALSSNALLISFFIYLIAIIPLGLAVKSKGKLFPFIGILMTWVGFLLQLVYFVVRWYVAGHAPVSNMYEFMTFFGIMLVGSFLIIYYLYRLPVIGLFALPISLLILGFANAFSKDVSPLIPALQSEWLTIHVLTVAFSSAVLSISFVTGLIYLLKEIDLTKKSKSAFFLEFVVYLLVVVVGFVIVTSGFRGFGYEKAIQFENMDGRAEVYEYTMPVITAPKDSVVIESKETGIVVDEKSGLIHLPNAIETQKLNTVLWSFFVGTVLYALTRLITRRKVAALFKPLTKKVNPTVMDEITYRSVVIGFPLFALGGLLFAMIWAHLAWSRFWGWDPKEVWALITFLFYAGMLHLRIGRGWEGERTAWMAIIGFGTIVFNQVFVNLIIAGLHSYA